MPKSIYRILRDMVSERTDEIVNSIARKNKTYKALSEEVSTAFLAVSHGLPSQEKKNLNKYQDAVEQREIIALKAIYQQGFMDGIRVSNLFNKLRNQDIGTLKRLLDK